MWSRLPAWNLKEILCIADLQTDGTTFQVNMIPIEEIGNAYTFTVIIHIYKSSNDSTTLNNFFGMSVKLISMTLFTSTKT